MARIDTNLMKTWKDQDVMKASDYVRERDMVVTAVNDIDGSYATSTELNDGLLANQTGDHLGTWQGLTPTDISVGLAVTPDQIGAASQSDFLALSDSVNNLKSLRYNMSDFPLIAPEMDDTPRIQRALDAVPDGAELTFPSANYVISSGLTINKSISVNFQGKAKILNNSSDSVFQILGDVDSTSYVLSSALTRGMQDIQLQQYPVGYAVGDMLHLQESPTSNNTETHEVYALTMTSTNLVTSPNMTADANSDGVVDGFTSATGTGATATYSLSAAQKINLTASTSPTDAGVFQANLAVTAGQPYSLLVQGMVENPVGSFKGQIVVSFYDAGSVLLGSTTKDFTNNAFQSIELHNLIAPASATKATVTFKAVAVTTGDTGAVYFKSAQFLNSTTKLTVNGFIRMPKLATSTVTKVFPIEHIRFKDFNYQMMEGATGGNGIYINYARDIAIDGLTTIRRTFPSIAFDTVMDVVVSRVNDSNPQITDNAAVVFTNGTSRGVLKDSIMQNGGTGGYVGVAHDILFTNNSVMHTTDGAFYLSDQGYSSDISVTNCRAINVPYGIIIQATDYTDTVASNVQLHNFLVSDCTIRLNDTGGVGVFTEVLFKGNGLTLNNVHVRYLSGAEGGYSSMTGTGVQFSPGKAKVTLINCTFEGMYSGIRLNSNGAQVTNDDSNIVVRDCTFRNLRGAVDIKNGLAINLLIYNMMCDSLDVCVFDNYSSDTQSYSELVIDGMSLVNSPGTDVWWDAAKTPVPPAGDSIRGVIQNIRTDRTSGVAPAASYNLTLEDLFFTLDGQTLYLRGTAVASNTTGKVFPDGLVDGQMLKVVTQSGSWVINKGTNIFFKAAATSITLASTGSQTASFVWMTKGTPGWYQIS